MTVREEPSPLTGGPRRRPGRRHRPRRSDPRRASRAWRRAPAQKQRPHRRTTSGRGGQGPDRPGAVRRRPSAAPEDRRDAITGRRHPRTVPPRSDPAGGEGGRPAPRSGGGRERSRFAPLARGRSWQVLVIGLRAAGARAGPARGRRPAPGRRRSRERAGGARVVWAARGACEAVSRARGRGSWRRPTGMMPASGLASARAGPTAREERHPRARNARRSTARRPSTTPCLPAPRSVHCRTASSRHPAEGTGPTGRPGSAREPPGRADHLFCS